MRASTVLLDNWESKLPFFFLRYEFEEFEHVSSMKTLELKSQETHSGFKTFLVVGTMYNFGEDLTCKGRVREVAISLVAISRMLVRRVLPDRYRITQEQFQYQGV